MLLDPYGGPHAQRVVQSHNAFLSSQWFADQGFAVVVIDGRGTPGRGSDWERAVHRDLATAVLDDQIDALLALAADDPVLDLSRVAIRGWSFGGFLAALAVIRRPDVFHAAVAGAPVTEWRLYDTHYTERYLGDPTHDAGPYADNSLLPLAPELTRPLLLIHGLADDNVVAAHSLQLSSALLAAGKPHELLALVGRDAHDAAGGRRREPPPPPARLPPPFARSGREVRAGIVAASALLTLVACGDGERDRSAARTTAEVPPATVRPATTTTTSSTTPAATTPTTEPVASSAAPEPDEETAPVESDAPSDSTGAPATTASDHTGATDDSIVAAPDWSAASAAELATLLGSIASPEATSDVVHRLLSSPVDLPLPADATLSGARVTVTADGDTASGTWTTSWRIAVATTQDADTLEQSLVSEFEDERFITGARVVSTLDSGVFVTLNHPPTDAAAAEGWELLAFGIGPESAATPTGRQELEMTVERVVPADAPGISDFLSGWVREIPLGDDLTFDRFEASLVELSTTGFWMSIVFHAPAEEFGSLVRFYAQDLTSGQLVLDESPVPDDIAAADRFSAGFFPTLAGHALSVTVSRDPALPDADVEVRFEIRMEPTG